MYKALQTQIGLILQWIKSKYGYYNFIGGSGHVVTWSSEQIVVFRSSAKTDYWTIVEDGYIGMSWKIMLEPRLLKSKDKWKMMPLEPKWYMMPFNKQLTTKEPI